MLADKKPVQPFDRAGWIFEQKFDGYRVALIKQSHSTAEQIAAAAEQLHRRDGLEHFLDVVGLQIITRAGTNAGAWFPEIIQDLLQIPGDWAMDAEVCVLNKQGNPDFPRMRAVARRHRQQLEDIHMYVFDLLKHNDEDLRARPLVERKAALKQLLARRRLKRVHYVKHIKTAGTRLFEDLVMRQGLEGVMAKLATAPYVAGARSSLWLKFKGKVHDGWNRRDPRVKGS